MKNIYNIQERVETSLAQYLAYARSVWSGEFFDNNTGGYVVTDLKRIANSRKSGNEQKKYSKELAMAKVLAMNGYHVEMLEENSRQKSHDINLDGIPAELKKIDSNRKIERRAHEAKEQGALIIVFEFERITDKTIKELQYLALNKIHGKYFERGTTRIHEF